MGLCSAEGNFAARITLDEIQILSIAPLLLEIEFIRGMDGLVKASITTVSGFYLRIAILGDVKWQRGLTRTQVSRTWDSLDPCRGAAVLVT